MKIEPFTTTDICAFLELAGEENWEAEEWEFDFLLSGFPLGCFTASDDSGAVAGFVTALLHERSGWIGNLIVAKKQRGKGLGGALLMSAMDSLRAAGAETIWLTASKSGTPIYEKLGFRSIDTIIRWVGVGSQRHAGHGAAAWHDELAGTSHDLDRNAWHDARKALLKVTAHRGKILQNRSGFIVQQPCGAAVQIGPFSASDLHSAEGLFDKAMGTVDVGRKVLLDAPVSNRSALRLFKRNKMKIVGSNLLMYMGKRPEYRPELIYGLATMGSCG